MPSKNHHEIQNSTLIGSFAALLSCLIAFRGLFLRGRIWAEEGRLFLGAMIEYSQGNNSSWLYLHSGHWDLWTTLIAAVAFMHPSKAPLIFSWGALPPYLLTGWSMTTYMQTQERTQTRRFAWIQGVLAILVLIFAGGPEVVFNTTNTQWILCIYVAFRLATLSQITEQNPWGWTQGLDCLAILSSFAGTILLPIQFACIGILQKRRHTGWWLFMLSSAGLWLGFAVQVMTSVLQHTSTTTNRALQPWIALKGFILQGMSGLLLPVNAISDYLFTSDGRPQIMVILAIGFTSLITIISLIHTTHTPSAAQQASVASLIAILITTLLYCQLAIGNKADLLIPGIGLRYFAPERVILAWLLICASTASGTTLFDSNKRTRRVVSGLASVLIVISGWSYFKPDALFFLGMTKNSCAKASDQAFSQLDHKWPQATSLPICPSGWTISL